MRGKRIIESYTRIDLKQYRKQLWLQSQSRRDEMRKTKKKYAKLSRTRLKVQMNVEMMIILHEQKEMNIAPYLI